MKNFSADLNAATTEEEVKYIFAKFFNLKLSTKNYIDLYTPQILFEFKFDSNLENLQTRAKIFAQTLYYVRRLKYGLNNEYRALSNFICVVTKNSAAILPTADFKNYYTEPNKNNFDWDLAPSSPCKKLIAALTEFSTLRDCHIYNFQTPADEQNFIARLRYNLQEQLSLFHDKKVINEFNFFEIFEYWQNQFGKYLADGRKPSEYFITDIESGKSEILGNNHVIFTMSDDTLVKKKFPVPLYNEFWNTYEKISAPREIISIRQKMDVMTEINRRRFTGEFFTPVAFAKKAVDYLSRTLGDKWWKKGNFRLWDMAAGTGNLEFALPAEALQYCYISTLLDDDAAYCKKIFPQATVFQYDYLNDDVEFLANPVLFQMNAKLKMPKNLRDDLNNPKIKWIIFINPPYATSNNPSRKSKENKVGVSMTAIRKIMTDEGMGECSRELFAQFFYRIDKEFKDRKVWLGIFSKLNYINNKNDQKLRDKFFKYQYERGFIFNSKNFQGCTDKFSIGFLIWNLAENIPLESQNISVDVFNNDVEKIAVKKINTAREENFLNKLIARPPAIRKFPPLSSALTVAAKNKDRRDRIAENFLASFMSKGNEFANQNFTALLSGPYVSAGALSVTPKNFSQSMIIHMVRRMIKASWLNDYDQFMQPTKSLSAEFISDAVIWSLFAPSNQTVSLKDVEYEGKIYQMPNNLYPYLLEEIKSWQMPSEILYQLEFAQDRYAALWLKNHSAEISYEGWQVLDGAKEIYKVFYENLDELDTVDLKIENWDAGWYQVRMAVKNLILDEKILFQSAVQKLSEKLLPQIYELGFLRDEVIYF
ncbi:MAG: hypothetical protein IJT73_09460 [Selenomonadaceae bacterium]|nr:hypothetical protein [Selenomonadaceae bacterium]